MLAVISSSTLFSLAGLKSGRPQNSCSFFKLPTVVFHSHLPGRLATIPGTKPRVEHISLCSLDLEVSVGWQAGLQGEWGLEALTDGEVGLRALRKDF